MAFKKHLRPLQVWAVWVQGSPIGLGVEFRQAKFLWSAAPCRVVTHGEDWFEYRLFRGRLQNALTGGADCAKTAMPPLSTHGSKPVALEGFIADLHLLFDESPYFDHSLNPEQLFNDNASLIRIRFHFEPTLAKCF